MTEDFIFKAIQYLEYEYKEEVLPMGPYLKCGSYMYYLQGARLFRLTPSYSYDTITPLIVSIEKILV